MTPKIIALTGATGYVGRFVTAELQRQGVTVRALARPESNRGGFNNSLEWIDGHLRDPDALEKLVDGADAVVHLAHEHVPGRYRGGEGDDLPAWLDANVNGSLRLLTAARNAHVKQFVFLSSRAVFSRTEPDRQLDESHPVSPDTHYGAYKVAVEAFLQSFARDMKTCSIRATGVYGLTWPPERSKWWDLVQAVLRDEPIPSSGGGTEVHGGDVARVIWSILTQSEVNIDLTHKSPGKGLSLLRMPASTPLALSGRGVGGEGGAFDIIHLSDLYVTHREVVRLAREIAKKPGPLPDAPASLPANPLVCRRISERGITLGGEELLEATIAELVHTATLF